MADTVVIENKPKKLGKFELRVHEVDLIRGILILIVLMDHILNCFLLNSENWYQITGAECWHGMYQSMVWYWNSVARHCVREVVLFSFCFISGLSCAFSRNNWKRAGLMVMIFAVLQVGSNLLQSFGWFGSTTLIIDFNVIGVLAFSTLFYCFVQKCSWKGILAAGLAWFLFSWYGMDIIRTIPGATSARVPSLMPQSIATADWMPLVPYIVFFFAGAVLTCFIYKDKKSKFTRHEWERPFCFIGRNTLWVYLGHQVVFLSIFAIITAILKAVY